MADRLIVVRHGNTFGPGETPRRVGSRTDLPLVDSGHRQAEKLAALLASDQWRFTMVLSSPLQRTMQTARAIAAGQDRPVEIVPTDWLREVDHGPDENQVEADVVGRIGSDALAAWDTAGQLPPDWTLDRSAVLAGWRALLDPDAYPSGDRLIVTSNGVARFIFAAGLDAGGRDRRLRTGAVGEVLLERGTPRLLRWDVRP